MLDVLGFKTTGDELFWAALGGIDGDALGGLDLAAVSLVARETATTSEARDFGASASEPPNFLHGGIISRGNLIEDSEVAVGDGATAFGSLSLEVILMVTFCLLGGGGFDGCGAVSKGSASMGLTLEDLAFAIKSLYQFVQNVVQQATDVQHLLLRCRRLDQQCPKTANYW